MELNLLVLDHRVSPEPLEQLKQSGVRVALTKLKEEDVFDGVDFHLCAEGERLARQADQFDVVIVGHNWGIGLFYCQMIPPSQKEKTLVVSNQNNRMDDQLYRENGFRHFAFRGQETRWLLDRIN